MKIDKKILVVVTSLILLIVIASLIYFFTRPVDKINEEKPLPDNPVFVQEYMTTSEKELLSMPTDLKVQVLNRDENGVPMTFKIINNDADILTTDSIPAIRPGKE